MQQHTCTINEILKIKSRWIQCSCSIKIQPFFACVDWKWNVGINKSFWDPYTRIRAKAETPMSANIHGRIWTFLPRSTPLRLGKYTDMCKNESINLIPNLYPDIIRDPLIRKQHLKPKQSIEYRILYQGITPVSQLL